MKTFTKLSGLGAVTLGLTLGVAGCAENNDSAAITSPTGAPKAGVTPPGAPTSSAAAAEASKANDPMQNAKDYPH